MSSTLLYFLGILFTGLGAWLLSLAGQKEGEKNAAKDKKDIIESVTKSRDSLLGEVKRYQTDLDQTREDLDSANRDLREKERKIEDLSNRSIGLEEETERQKRYKSYATYSPDGRDGLGVTLTTTLEPGWRELIVLQDYGDGGSSISPIIRADIMPKVEAFIEKFPDWPYVYWVRSALHDKIFNNKAASRNDIQIAIKKLEQVVSFPEHNEKHDEMLKHFKEIAKSGFKFEDQ